MAFTILYYYRHYIKFCISVKTDKMVILPIYLTSIVIITNGVLGHSPFKNNAVKPLTPINKPIHPITPATLEIASESAFGTSLNKNRNPFEIIYQWKILDFQYPSSAHRARAIASGDFVPENNLPLGVDSAGDRLFITLPRWKNGVKKNRILNHSCSDPHMNFSNSRYQQV